MAGKAGKDEVVQDETFKMNAAQKKGKTLLKKESSVLEPIFGTKDTAVGGELALTLEISSGDLQELDEKCNAMMDKTSGKNARGQPLYRCKVCGKEEINGAIKSHIETNHLEGVSIPCNFCEKTFRSRNSLAKHTNDKHKHI